MNEQIVTATVDTSAPPLTLREHIAAEEPAQAKPAVEKPVVTEPVKADPAPDAAVAEADSTKPDAELSEAGRTLRRNRADERKAKIQREIDEKVREREETRADVDRLRRERDELARGREARETTPTAGGERPADPTDPEPVFADWATRNTLEAFAAKHPNHPDPYAGWQTDFNKEWSRWDRRQETKAADASRQRQQAQSQVERNATRYHETSAVAKTKYTDFDAVTDSFFSAHSGRPTDPLVAYVVSSAADPGEMAYHLAKHPTALTDLAALPDRAALDRAIGRLDAQITVPAKAATPKPVTNAPEPPKQTVGNNGASVATLDTTKLGTPLRDHIAVEEAEIAERRKRGYRY